MIKRLLLSILLLTTSIFWKGAGIEVSAQGGLENYPVTATPIFGAPFSLKVSEYFSSTNRLYVDLLLKDLTKNEVQCYLKWSLEGPGVHISTRDGYIPNSFITLQRGRVNRQNGLDLQQNYYRADVLEADGMDILDVMNGYLPEGFYTFKVQAMEAGTGREVSNQGEAYFFVTSPYPPIVNIPFNESEVIATNPQNVMVQWTPRHLAVAGSQVVYELKIYEVPDDSEPNDVVNALFPIVNTTTPATFYRIGASDQALTLGKRYAVQVTAKDLGDKINNFVNQGRSEVIWFRYGKGCTVPKDVAVAKTGKGRVTLSWEATEGAKGYEIAYRNTDEDNWIQQNSINTTAPIDLPLGTATYEFKVKAVCDDKGNTNSQSSFSDIASISLNDSTLNNANLFDPFATKTTASIGNTIDKPQSWDDLLTKLKPPVCAMLGNNYQCDSGDPAYTLPTGEDLPNLKVGDVLGIYDFAVIVTSPPDASGVGKGIMKLPFMDNAFVQVEFKNIRVKKGEAGTNGGCVYYVPDNIDEGYFQVKNTPGTTGEVSLADLYKTLIDPSSFSGTFDEALKAYDEKSKQIAASGSTDPKDWQDLQTYTKAISQAGDIWKDVLIKQYSPLAETSDRPNGGTLVVNIIKSLDSLKTLINTPGANIADLEKQYKDLLDEFNHPKPCPTNTTPAIASDLVTIDQLVACAKTSTLTSYDPIHKTNCGDSLSYYGMANGTSPYWTLKTGTETYFITQNGTPNNFSITTQTQWLAKDRSQTKACDAGLWQNVTFKGDIANPTYAIKNLKVTNVLEKTAMVSWEKNPAMVSYEVTYKTADAAPLVLNTEEDHVDLTGLTTNTHYTVTVKGYDANKKLLASTSSVEFTTINPGYVINNVKVTNVLEKTATVSWQKNPAIASYQVIYKADDAEPLVLDTQDGSINLAGLTANTHYTVTIKGYDADKKLLATTTPVDFTTINPAYAINNIKITNVLEKSATITWDANDAFTRYQVIYKEAGAGELIADLTDPKLDLSKLKGDTKYTFTIKAYKGNTLLATSAEGTFSTTKAGYLAPPQNIKATRVDDNTLTLAWDKNIDHKSYKLVYTDNTGTEHSLYPTTNTVNINNLDPSQKYPYKLVAINGSLNSDPANGQFTTLLPKPCTEMLSLSSIVAADYKSATLNWTPITGQTSTKLSYALQVTGQEPVWQDLPNVNTSTTTITGLELNKSYQYKATPICASNSGSLTGTESNGAFSTSKQKVKPTVDYACGNNNSPTPPANQTKITDLQVGDYIKIGDFPVRITELSGSNPYTGRGAVLIPYLGASNYLVSLENISVNTDYEVIGGSMKGITDPVLRAALTGARNNTDATKENASPVVDKPFDQPVTAVAIKKDASGNPIKDANGNPVAVVTLADGSTKEVPVTSNLNITGSDGKQVAISKDGTMSPADGKPVTPPTTVPKVDQNKIGDGSLIVKFSADPDQKHGFDGVEDGTGVWGRGNFSLGGATYQVPIKAVQAGEDDYVRFTKTGNGVVKFSWEVNGKSIEITPAGDKITLNCPYEGNAQLIATDDKGNMVGKLQVLSYTPIVKNVVLVSLNGSTIPNNTSLQTELNKIFTQGCLSVNISNKSFSSNTVTGSINAERDHYKYSSDMQKIIGEFKKTSDYTDDKNTVFLFFANSSTAGLEGVMNRGYQFGFIFNQDAKVIAHELGHGLFALEHTENDGSNGKATDDLMGASSTGSAKLYKYQWALMRNPTSVWGIVESANEQEFSLPILAPNGKLLKTSYNAIICKSTQKQKDYFVIAGYAEGSPVGIAINGSSTLEYYWDKNATPQTYRKLIDWSNTAPNLGASLADAIYTDITPSSKYWKIIYGTNNTVIYQQMEGSTVLSTTLSRTCAASTVPLVCEEQNTFNASNAASVAYLINSQYSDECIAKLNLDTRKNYLTTLRTGFANNAGGTYDVKNASIKLLKLISETNQESLLLNYLEAQGIYYYYIDQFSGDNLYDFATIVSQWIYKYKTSRSDLITANEGQKLALGLLGTANGASIASNTLSFKVVGNDYDANPTTGSAGNTVWPLKVLWTSSTKADEYLYLHFQSDYSIGVFNFKKGMTYPVPGLLAYAIFNKNKWDNIQRTATVTFDIATLAIGVGEVAVVINEVNDINKTFRLIKSLTDVGLTVGDIVINNDIVANLSQTDKDRWNKISFLYFSASLATEGVNALLKWKNKKLTQTEFKLMLNEVESAGKLGDLAELLKNEDFKTIYNGLVDGSIERRFTNELLIEEEAIYKYYTTSSYYDFNQSLILGNSSNSTKALENLLNDVLSKLSPSPGSFYRGIGKTEIDFYKSLSIDQEFTMPNFLSSSSDFDRAIRFYNTNLSKTGEAAIITIVSKNGRKIAKYSDASFEKEILFKSKSKYVFKDMKITEDIDNLDNVMLYGETPIKTNRLHIKIEEL